MTYKVIFHARDETETPFAVTRRAQVFTYDIGWRPWSRRDRQEWQAHPGRDCQVRKVGRQEAAEAIERIAADSRCADQARWINRIYRYYAADGEVVRANLADKDTVSFERFDDLRWTSAGRPAGHFTEVEPEDADEFKARFGVMEPEPPRPVVSKDGADQKAESGDYIVTENGSDRPLALIVADARSDWSRERVRAYAGLNAWEQSDLLAQIAAGQYNWTAHNVDQTRYSDADKMLGDAIRRADHAGWIHRDVRYYFVVDSEAYRTPVHALVRVKRNRQADEESFVNGQWERSFILAEMSRGKGIYDFNWTVEASGADARRFMAGHYRRGQ